MKRRTIILPIVAYGALVVLSWNILQPIPRWSYHPTKPFTVFTADDDFIVGGDCHSEHHPGYETQWSTLFNSIRVLDARTGTVLSRLNFDEAVCDVKFFPAQHSILYSVLDPSRLPLARAQAQSAQNADPSWRLFHWTKKSTKTIPGPIDSGKATISPDGRYLSICAGAKSACPKLVDLGPTEVESTMRNFPIPFNFGTAHFSSSSKAIVYISAATTGICIYETATRKKIAQDENARLATMSPDGRFVAYHHDNIIVRDLDTNATVEIGASLPKAIKFSPDSKSIAVLANDLRLFSVMSGKERMRVELPEKPTPCDIDFLTSDFVCAVFNHSDENELQTLKAVVFDDSLVWNAQTGQPQIPEFLRDIQRTLPWVQLHRGHFQEIIFPRPWINTFDPGIRFIDLGCNAPYRLDLQRKVLASSRQFESVFAYVKRRFDSFGSGVNWFLNNDCTEFTTWEVTTGNPLATVTTNSADFIRIGCDALTVSTKQISGFTSEPNSITVWDYPLRKPYLRIFLWPAVPALFLFGALFFRSRRIRRAITLG